MKKSLRALSGALILMSSAAAVAQTAPAPAGQAVIVGGGPSNVLRAGVTVPLKMSEGLTTEGKKLRVGQRFQLEVASDVTLNGNIVIPAGSPAIGEVTDVRNKGMWGKSGRIGARVLHVRANGRQIRLTGVVDDKGVTGTAGVVGAIALVPIAGFVVTGTSARIPVNAPVTAFLDEDLVVEFAPAAAPAAMVVPSATPATTSAAAVSTSRK